MKKTILALAALATLAFTSCQKEEASFVKSFKISTESCTYQGAKTQIAPDGHNVYWTPGDQILVYGSTSEDWFESIFQVTPSADDPTRFEATYVSGDQFGSLDDAQGFIYPASYCDGGEINYPFVQQSATGDIDKLPMAGFKIGDEIRFFHQFGLLKLHLTKPNVSVSDILVITDKAVCGNWGDQLSSSAAPYFSNASYPVAAECGDDGFNATVLVMDTPQDITDGKDFYISLPEGDFNTFIIRIFTSNDSVATMTANGTISIERAKITSVTAGSSLVFTEYEGE